MNKRHITISLVFILALVSTTILTACGSSSSSSPSSTPTATTNSSIDAQALLSQQCSRCHPLTRVTTKTKTAAEWKITVDRMIKHGARLTTDQEQALIDYLAQNF